LPAVRRLRLPRDLPEQHPGRGAVRIGVDLEAASGLGVVHLRAKPGNWAAPGPAQGAAGFLEYFALINLGLVECLARGVLSATEALHRFYHADNCLYVRNHLRSKEAHTIMSHGVQLPDLFEFLPAEEAQREFSYELETIRSLCVKLLEKERAIRVKPRSR
ncbi:MAG: hypothetical protein ACREJL_00500, partial [Candidatus Methylomirabilales bacterium]